MMSLAPAILKVVKPGIYCALQDAGRLGYRHLGVPVSGAMDGQSFRYINKISGNPPDATVLEIYGQGVVLEALEDSLIYFGGASSQISIDDEIADWNQPIHLKKNQQLKVIKLSKGCWLYLTVPAGFFAEQIMGSTSTIVGTPLQRLVKNDVLYQAMPKNNKDGQISALSPVQINKNCSVYCTKGPEYDQLSESSKSLIARSVFYATKNSNRMGYRLSGEALHLRHENSMLTSAVMPGTVQLLPDGQLIVLMRECQTTGGYPRILQVCEPSLNQLVHRSAGDAISFTLI